MTLSQNGIDYICQNFGDTNLCCVRTGQGWYYTASGQNYNETGGTAQIVSRLASGLITSLTMTNPARGTFTQAQLNTANGSAVTLPDAQTVAQHDQSPNQWCYGGGATCSDYTSQADCEAASCYWCTNHCQSPPCGYPTPINWLLIGGLIAAGALVGIVLIVRKK
jgi:hypothetical protein